LFHDKKHPKDLGEHHIKRFLTHLAVLVRLRIRRCRPSFSSIVRF
jgi:hypothetical protein